jgi:hypothetical protein
MRASLHSRKNIRLKWFDLKDIDYKTEYKIDLSYTSHSVEENLRNHTAYSKYIFFHVEQEVPQSDIIIFEKDLPASYAKTAGSKGNKFSTESKSDPSLTVKDRIVELQKGKEKITRQPPSYPSSRIKEIEVRERKDTVKRKIIFENETNDKKEHIECKFVETKDVRFTSSNPKVSKKDPPEYCWTFEIEPEGSYVIEIELEVHIIQSFEIEKEQPPKSVSNASLSQVGDVFTETVEEPLTEQEY